LNKQLKERADHEEELKQEALALKERLKDLKLEFSLNTSKGGNTFGQISSKQIVAALEKEGIHVDKRKILMDTPVDSLGTTIVKADLYRNQVIADIAVHVSAKE
jgi:large subunit ribosomal protein L9